MTTPSARFFEGRKFMSDGSTYETREAAEQAKSGYEAERFEVQLVEQDNRYSLYTRRVVTEVKVEGAPV